MLNIHGLLVTDTISEQSSKKCDLSKDDLLPIENITTRNNLVRKDNLSNRGCFHLNENTCISNRGCFLLIDNLSRKKKSLCHKESRLTSHTHRQYFKTRWLTHDRQSLKDDILKDILSCA